jgi:photosystem II stability/assembly factor-like uncharacterized protein
MRLLTPVAVLALTSVVLTVGLCRSQMRYLGPEMAEALEPARNEKPGVFQKQEKQELSPAVLEKARIELLSKIEQLKAVAANDMSGKKFKDNPREGAMFQQKLRTSPGAKGKDPYFAIPSAIQRIRAMRVETAVKSELHPQMMAVLAGRGFQGAYVGGIPVGPLPAIGPSTLDISPKGIKNLPPGATKLLEQLAVPLVAPLSSPIQPGTWKWLGPANIGGRTRAVVIDPTNPQTIYLGGVAGGVWRSLNGGQSWAPLNDFMASLVVSCMVMDPTNPKRVLVGTGEGFLNLDALRGAGIFATANGGETWNQLEGTKDRTEFYWVNRLALSADGKTLLVGTRSGLYRSVDSFSTFGKVLGKEMLDVKFDPNDPRKAVAGGRNGMAWFSIDAGQNWQPAEGLPPQAGDLGRTELVYAASDSKLVYASVDAFAFNLGGDPKQPQYGHVYLSKDGGKTFKLLSQPGHLSGQGWYANCLWAGDPSDPNTLIVGGLNLHRSQDGGKTFAPVSDWQKAPLSAHADHHVIVSHPGFDGINNRSVFFGNDGGFYESDDILQVAPGQGWRNLNNGLGITQFYGAAANVKLGILMGGAQDNGTLVYTPQSVTPAPHQGISGWFDYGLDGLAWSGDGGVCAADPSAPFFFGEYVNLVIHRSDGKSGYKSINQTILESGIPNYSLFIAPYILDPNDSRTMLAGAARLYRSTDVQAAVVKFNVVKDFLFDPNNSNSFTVVSAVAVPRGQPKMAWVGYELDQNASSNSGAVFLTRDVTAASPIWQRMGKGVLPNRHCQRLVIDPSDTRRVYALFGGYEKTNLYVTKDEGATWVLLGGTVLPEAPLFDLAIHPDDSKIIILGTEVGLFVSNDQGMSWSPTNQGPTNCSVQQLFWMGKTLVAVTHGRGIFTIDLSQATQPRANRFGLPPTATPKL